VASPPQKTGNRRVPVDLRGLTAKQDIFRVSAMAMHEMDVEVWLADAQGEHSELSCETR
jgi:hypothetical protein